MSLLEDVKIAKLALANIPTDWDGKTCVLEMKEANFQWRQMEWWGFYFELQVRRLLASEFEIPGDKYNKVTFDLKRSVNWDLKAKAIKSDDHRAILNDKTAMESSIAAYGEHGVIMALCDVEYNDTNRCFQKWHTELKGGKSNYEKAREGRTSVSRYRKTYVEVAEILFLRIDADNIGYLDTMKQGRNSNSKPRKEKYMLDLENLEHFIVD
ncbi:MAG: hypothetical protein NT023_11790 [Armatimonadetes bacterium]|nr:hypothetical protein [Armatimonadota bacterium]